MEKRFKMNGWVITEAELKERVMKDRKDEKAQEDDDLLVGFDDPRGVWGGEFEFHGDFYDGFAVHEEGFCYMVYPTLAEFNESNEKDNFYMQDVIEDYTGYVGRGVNPSYHDLAMCFGILFVFDNKLFNKSPKFN